MPNHKGKHADRGLVNAKANSNSTLTIRLEDGFAIKGFDVQGDVTDSSPKLKGVWSAKRLKKDDVGIGDSELRLLLTCKTQPEKVGPPPDAGTLTITLAKGQTTETVTQDVDYANDDPP